MFFLSKYKNRIFRQAGLEKKEQTFRVLIF